MRRLVLALVGAALAVAMMGGVASAFEPPANSPWLVGRSACTTPQGTPGFEYLNTHSGRTACFEL